MNATLHLAPEDIMALLDGELSATEAHHAHAHLATCSQCATLATHFRETSEMLAAWKVPALPTEREASIADSIPTQPLANPANDGRWLVWAIPAAGLAAIMMVIVVTDTLNKHSSHAMLSHRTMPNLTTALIAHQKVATPANSLVHTIDQLHEEPTAKPSDAAASDRYADTGTIPAPKVPPTPADKQFDRLDTFAKLFTPGPNTPASAPMIARSITLSLFAPNVDAARTRVDGILVRYQGYTANLSDVTANDVRALSASLRIPAPELPAALADLKSLGKVEQEEQKGEDITQQHADLAARLRNAHETEDRLRGILQQRTGKMSDVLEVEEEIDRVRGEIEEMEAQQQTLEHRVSFATIDLTITASQTPKTDSVSTRIQHSIAAGCQNAADMLLSLALFSAEEGPTIAIWLLILAVPGFFLWRRYKRIRSHEC